MPRHLRRNNGEHLVHQFLGGYVAFPAHTARILIFDLGTAFLKLLNDHVDALQDVDWLETGDDKGHMISSRQRLIFFVTDDRTNVPGGQKTLYPVAG